MTEPTPPLSLYTLTLQLEAEVAASNTEYITNISLLELKEEVMKTAGCGKDDFSMGKLEIDPLNGYSVKISFNCAFFATKLSKTLETRKPIQDLGKEFITPSTYADEPIVKSHRFFEGNEQDAGQGLGTPYVMYTVPASISSSDLYNIFTPYGKITTFEHNGGQAEITFESRVNVDRFTTNHVKRMRNPHRLITYNTLPKTSLNIILAKLKLYGSSEVRYRLDQIGNQKLHFMDIYFSLPADAQRFKDQINSETSNPRGWWFFGPAFALPTKAPSEAEIDEAYRGITNHIDRIKNRNPLSSAATSASPEYEYGPFFGWQELLLHSQTPTMDAYNNGKKRGQDHLDEAGGGRPTKRARINNTNNKVHQSAKPATGNGKAGNNTDSKSTANPNPTPGTIWPRIHLAGSGLRAQPLQELQAELTRSDPPPDYPSPSEAQEWGEDVDLVEVFKSAVKVEKWVKAMAGVAEVPVVEPLSKQKSKQLLENVVNQ